MPRHYVLLDACVPAAHYAPKSTTSINLRERSRALLTGHSNTRDIRFLIPSFGIAEVFAVFEKYRWGQTWNRQVSDANCLTPTEFRHARRDFGAAIHNGRTILQLELNRYHVLCVDLVSPINNKYKFNRDRRKATGGKSGRKPPLPFSTADALLISMGIWLKHLVGDGSLTLVTGDARITNVVARAKSEKLALPMKRHLSAVAGNVGLTFGPAIYPDVVNLIGATKGEMAEAFPDWVPQW